MKKLLLLPLLLTACQPPTLDKAKIDAAIEQQLRAGPVQRTAFLTLNYGDSRADVAAKLVQLKDAGIVAELRMSEGDTEPTQASGYQFTTPYALAVVKWNLNPAFHNDSLTQVHLFAIKPEGSVLEYEALREKYQAVYGEPVASIPTECVFVKGSQRVDINTDYDIFQVIYQNTALAKRIDGGLLGDKFDENGNSYDSAYYRKVVKPRKVVNPDRI